MTSAWMGVERRLAERQAEWLWGLKNRELGEKRLNKNRIAVRQIRGRKRGRECVKAG
jgi:hypothetical protein